MNKVWSKTPPKLEGWYWVKYKGKHGVVSCPAKFIPFNKKEEFLIRTALNDTFFSFSVDKGQDLKYGPGIEYPPI